MQKILNKNDLINYFKSGEKTTNNLLIGAEHEKFIFQLKTKKPINYQEHILPLFRILKENGWNDILENDYIIGLKKDQHSITLEPGLQIELSGTAVKSIHEICKEVNQYLKELKLACSKINLGIIGIGFVPNANLSEVGRLHKKRYEIMRKYMPSVGSLGLEMMHRTAATQVNLDYRSEDDFKMKSKVISCLIPISVALFSNSPIKENKLNGFLNYRTHIWQNTDKDRSGLIPFFFEDSNSYEKYVDFALKVPMYFAYQNKNIVDCTGENFSNFIQGKLKKLPNQIANIEDWGNHLSTIFTEVRVKKYLEVRSADSCSWSGICSIPGFWTGILYDQSILKESFEYFKKWKFKEVQEAYLKVPKQGFDTELYGKKIIEYAKLFIDFSLKGLKNRNILNSNGDSEEVYLEDLKKIVHQGKSLAQLLIDNFEVKYKNNIDLIFNEKAF